MDIFVNGLPKPESGEYSTQSLAYLGDAVYELLVRSRVLADGEGKIGEMNARADGITNAAAQSETYRRLAPHLSDEEAAILRRGRNIAPKGRPKGASVSEYRHATGVETLFGYLYARGRVERIRELFDMCMYGNSE